MVRISDNELKEAICNNDWGFLRNHVKASSVNYRLHDEDNDTLLSYSISNPSSKVYTFFLDKYADLNAINDAGENILHSAIYSGSLERVKQVITNGNINGTSNDGTTPLLLALGLEYEDIANFLIDNGADVDIGDLEDNRPIHLASFFGLYSTVLRLIQKGVDLMPKTAKGNLPLALAVNQNHTKVVKVLFKEMYD